MKRLLLFICVPVISMTAASAQTSDRSLETTGIRLVDADGQVEVSFTLDAGKRAVEPGYNLVVNPVLRNGDRQRRLAPIIIRGKRSEILDRRHEMAARVRVYEHKPVYMAPGKALEYRAAVPFEEWMRGASLAFEGVSVGCCSSSEVTLGLVAENILDGGPGVETTIVEIPPAVTPTTGELMADRYPFVAPSSEFELLKEVLGQSPNTFDDGRNELSQRVIDQIREGSISIYFRQGLHDVDRNYSTNNGNLVELIAAVRALATAHDSEIEAIIIAGFASPEGTLGFNDRLAWNRAVAVKGFLVGNTDVDPDAVRLYNGAVDWYGLREQVAASDLYDRGRILDIIDNTPVWGSGQGGRLGELTRLDGGRTYRYMLENYFPKLRQAAYIKVYYRDK